MANKQLGEVNKLKPSSLVKPAAEVVNSLIPKTPLDIALTVFPYGKAARATGGIIGKGARYVAKLYR